MSNFVKRYVVPYWTQVMFFWGAAILFFGLLVSFAHKRMVYAELAAGNALKPVLMQKIAPDFSFDGGDKKKPAVDLSDLKGRFVLLHFWATWCPPCREELPSLELLARHFKDRLAIVAASVDENWADVENLFAKKAPSFKLVWDKGKQNAQKYEATKFPETFLISPQGQIVARFAGSRDWATKQAIQYLEKMIK